LFNGARGQKSESNFQRLVLEVFFGKRSPKLKFGIASKKNQNPSINSNYRIVKEVKERRIKMFRSYC